MTIGRKILQEQIDLEMIEDGNIIDISKDKAMVKTDKGVYIGGFGGVLYLTYAEIKVLTSIE